MLLFIIIFSLFVFNLGYSNIYPKTLKYNNFLVRAKYQTLNFEEFDLWDDLTVGSEYDIEEIYLLKNTTIANFTKNNF